MSSSMLPFSVDQKKIIFGALVGAAGYYLLPAYIPAPPLAIAVGSGAIGYWWAPASVVGV